MIEIPECAAWAEPLAFHCAGKKVRSAAAGEVPHKMAFYYGDPADYGQRLAGQTVIFVRSCAGYLSLGFEASSLILAEGLTLRAWQADEARPAKRQLLIEFDDGCGLTASVQMYGGLWLVDGANFDNIYYQRAKAAPSVFSDDFSYDYFRGLSDYGLSGKSAGPKLSAKAFLAVDQRIPGLGNGCLQDILWTAAIHPKRQIGSLSDLEWQSLYEAVRTTLRTMTDQGGRDSETNLWGQAGAYPCIASKRTVGTACRRCGNLIIKQAYLGGSVYFCPSCQKL